MDIKLQLVQEFIPLGLVHIGEVLTEEIRAFAGDRYKSLQKLRGVDEGLFMLLCQ